MFSVGATLLAACIALAGLILVSTGRIAEESRAGREALRAEARADREAFQAEMRAYRAEAQADRVAFTRQIARLTERQGRFDGLVEGLRERPPDPTAPVAAGG